MGKLLQFSSMIKKLFSGNDQTKIMSLNSVIPHKPQVTSEMQVNE